jgi:hypothetical protein
MLLFIFLVDLKIYPNKSIEIKLKNNIKFIFFFFLDFLFLLSKIDLNHIFQ